MVILILILPLLASAVGSVVCLYLFERTKETQFISQGSIFALLGVLQAISLLVGFSLTPLG